jgi:hypothetical protein
MLEHLLQPDDIGEEFYDHGLWLLSLDAQEIETRLVAMSEQLRAGMVRGVELADLLERELPPVNRLLRDMRGYGLDREREDAAICVNCLRDYKTRLAFGPSLSPDELHELVCLLSEPFGDCESNRLSVRLRVIAEKAPGSDE